MFDWLRRLTGQNRDVIELAALDARDFADMGVSRDQALNLAAMPQAVVDRVQAMGHVFGLAPAALAQSRADWVQMVETCAQCNNVAQCTRFLRQDGHPDAPGAGFCPDRALFAEHTVSPVRQAA